MKDILEKLIEDKNSHKITLVQMKTDMTHADELLNMIFSSDSSSSNNSSIEKKQSDRRISLLRPETSPNEAFAAK